MTPDPLTAACTFCGSGPGMRCGTYSGWARKPHAARVKLALVLAAHTDPALDAFGPPLGPCGLCSVPGLNQRHRMVDAVAGMLDAGEDPEAAACEYQVPLPAVEVVATWMIKYPGAWL